MRTPRIRHGLVAAIAALLILGCFYFGFELLFHAYIFSSARHLVSLEKKGRLSKKYGFVWQEINRNTSMQNVSSASETPVDTMPLSHRHGRNRKDSVLDFPSLSAVKQLNAIRSLYSMINVTDRYGYPLAQLRTTHTCISVSELPDVLIKALIFTEDKHFFKRDVAYEYRSLVRAVVLSLWRSVTSLHLVYPQGSSTIPQQVARFLLMKVDSRGYAYAEKSVSRKLKEVKLAQALRMLYTNEEILTLYVNHCVSAGKGKVGYYDISMSLFGKSPKEIDTCQSLYLSRLVKWNRHLPKKIIRQIKVTLPAIGGYFGWNSRMLDTMRSRLDRLAFQKPLPSISQHSHLLDLANEYWLEACRISDLGVSADMDMSSPESLIRRHGNLTIALTIDARLQTTLETAVNKRGFGPDTVVRTDVKIGSFGENVPFRKAFHDTVRIQRLLRKDSTFIDPTSNVIVSLSKGDTLITNIRYKRTDTKTARRSVFYYKRDTITVPGQYFSYAIINARNKELLAYYSRDQLGSRLYSLLKNRTPNGSCIAKPLIYALAYDFGIYESTDMGTDSSEIEPSYLWARKFLFEKDRAVGVSYGNSTEPGGYQVRNYSRQFDGYDHLYNHLSHSNNIMCVETAYRLWTDFKGDKSPHADAARDYLQRIHRWERYREAGQISGPRLYAELAGVCGAPLEVSLAEGKTAYIPQDYYSVALGTFELTLYEQLHLFTTMHGNTIVSKPASHPSLFIKSIVLNGKPVRFPDTVVQYQVFSDMKNILPVNLAMHKRLLSNPADSLWPYDVCVDEERIGGSDGETVSNFAKSGTTDDVIRPYNVDVTDDVSKTNYGLWNAVLRVNLRRNHMASLLKDTTASALRMERFSLNRVPAEETIDIALACIGECNEAHTGTRDGKTMHQYVSRTLLHTYGVACSDGFYTRYEDKLIRQTPSEVKYAYLQENSDIPFFKRTWIRFQTLFGSKSRIDEVRFEKGKGALVRLEGTGYRRLLTYAPYLGTESKKYLVLLETLGKEISQKRARYVLNEMRNLSINNQFLRREIGAACDALNTSLDRLAK
ncbi:MAG: transglycosylase domain-containing protein [Chitinivibrionales bacterium]|nr:transglycosylase domain-containing protein [Chitinivibrionales bacterium]